MAASDARTGIRLTSIEGKLQAMADALIRIEEGQRTTTATVADLAKCQVQLNGRTTHLEEREKSHSRDLGDLDAQIAALSERTAVTSAVTDTRDKEHERRLAEGDTEHRWTRERVLDLSKKVASIGAVLAVLLKLYGADIAKLVGVIPK